MLSKVSAPSSARRTRAASPRSSKWTRKVLPRSSPCSRRSPKPFRRPNRRSPHAFRGGSARTLLGDSHDFLKYAFLRHLHKAGGWRIGLNWYLTHHGEVDRPDSNDG